MCTVESSVPNHMVGQSWAMDSLLDGSVFVEVAVDKMEFSLEF